MLGVEPQFTNIYLVTLLSQLTQLLYKEVLSSVNPEDQKRRVFTLCFLFTVVPFKHEGKYIIYITKLSIISIWYFECLHDENGGVYSDYNC
jgi:hypothetical protein